MTSACALLTVILFAQPAPVPPSSSLAPRPSPLAPPSLRGPAILASLALPGTGQLLLGSHQRGEAILWLEGTLWACYSGFSWYSAAREHDARLFAAHEARADVTVKESRYYRALERFDNAEEYNEGVRADARAFYPDDPQRQRDYYLSQGYFGAQAWDWSSDSSRFGYWRTRKSSRNAALRAQFVAGALVLNRLVSVVDCAFFAGRKSATARVELQPVLEDPGIRVCYRF